MINDDVISAFNARQTVNPNSLKKMTPAQKDKVKHHGSMAEALLQNKEFAMFVHQFKFELNDDVCEITSHTQDDNAKRVAICNQLSGIDSFVAMLQRMAYYKKQVVTDQQKLVESDSTVETNGMPIKF